VLAAAAGPTPQLLPFQRRVTATATPPNGLVLPQPTAHVSSLAHRAILSTAVLFLAAGFVLGADTTGVLDLTAGSPIVATLAELALFAVLFTDGMRVGWADLRTAWRLPGRALGWGLPLTLAITALLARYVAGLDWPEALLVGAILAPTDPVFAAALLHLLDRDGCGGSVGVHSFLSVTSSTDPCGRRTPAASSRWRRPPQARRRHSGEAPGGTGTPQPVAH